MSEVDRVAIHAHVSALREAIKDEDDQLARQSLSIALPNLLEVALYDLNRIADAVSERPAPGLAQRLEDIDAAIGRLWKQFKL